MINDEPTGTKKDVVLFVNAVKQGLPEALDKLNDILGYPVIGVVLRERNYSPTKTDVENQFETKVVDYSDLNSVDRAVSDIRPRLLAITARGEINALKLAGLAPSFPELLTADPEAIRASTNKVDMRTRISEYDDSVLPRFVESTEGLEESIKLAEDKVGYPMMVKPSGLFSSILIAECNNQDELRENLGNALKQIKDIYLGAKRHDKPRIIIEQMLKGELYSIDSHVDDDGNIFHTPSCHYVTGHAVGIDDYHLYRRDLPSGLGKEEEEAAQKAAEISINGLGLRNSSAHIELINTDEGWKLIEIGPRIGRFRPKMYELSFGIDHSLNDLLVRIPNQKPIIPLKPIGHTVALTYFSKDVGIIKSIQGLDAVKSLSTLVHVIEHKKPGDEAKYSKDGGKAILEVMLSGPDKATVDADVKELEDALNIVVE